MNFKIFWEAFLQTSIKGKKKKKKGYNSGKVSCSVTLWNNIHPGNKPTGRLYLQPGVRLDLQKLELRIVGVHKLTDRNTVPLAKGAP